MTDGDLRNLHILLSLFNPFSATIAKALFSVEVLVMFSFFLVSGNPEGFSAIWICMLPSLGMFFFGRFRGSALCAVMRLVRDQLTGVLNRQRMYAVLENDINTCICTKDLLMKAAAQSRLRERLSRAIDNDRFKPFLPFVYDVRNHRFAGAEVLSRWNDPEEGMRTPAYYINDMRVTGVTISSGNFLKAFREVTGRYNFDHSRLILEITEDTLIDRQFINKNNCGDALLRELIHLAHNLHVEVVCEGIETKQQEDTVIHNDCDYIQGYLYSYVFPVGEARKYYLSALSETDTEN